MARVSSSAPILWKPGSGPVGLYVHVPFCRAICTYCAFAKGEYDAAKAELWLTGLEREIAVRSRTTWQDRPRVDTLFLGGGTPSTLTPTQWRRLCEILGAGFDLGDDIEFTSEANPESFTEEIALTMKEVGVNRLSLGAQSLDRAELTMLGRIHDAGDVAAAVGVARTAGFDNVNLDVMYALPGQTEGTFRDTLAGVLAMRPDHLSAYCLGLEPGTPLAGDVNQGRLPLPVDETARRLYDLLTEQVAGAGYELYEISNFARPGRVSRHNTRYWTRADVIALGPSAHGLLGNHRWANPAPLELWVNAYSHGGASPTPKPVPVELARFEWMFLHLRLADGFSKSEFAEEWSASLDEDYGETVQRLTAAGFLEAGEDRVRLSTAARFVSDAVFAEFAP